MSRFLQNPMTVLGLLLVGLLAGGALLAPVLPLADPEATQLEQRLLPPGSEGHLLGTDSLGRDLLSRLLWGTRLSIAVAAAATLVAATLGSLIGILAGYFGRWVEVILMRSMDVALAFPYLILALAIVAILGPGLVNALLAIAIVNIPFFARTVRAVTLGVCRQSFVESARMSGQSHTGILARDILPNVLPTIIIAASTTFGWMILETAGLSFLGLGAQPPRADLGSMLADSRSLILIAPHTGILPGLVILALVLGLNLVGDGLRDLLDPKMRGAGSVRPQPSTRVEKAVAAPETAPTEAAEGLRVRDLRIAFGPRQGGRSPGVNGVSFDLGPGEALGMVGESGSGKTVSAMAILRLVPSPPAVIEAGEIQHHGGNLLTLNGEDLRQLRGNRIAVIFQDPLSSLNPLETIGYQVDEAILTHQALSPAEARLKTLDLLRQMDLPQPETKVRQYPHQLSGGQRQRVGIAMALANDPDLIIADEPTTALDVTVQRKILQQIDRIRRERGTALLFISHDLAVVSQLCDRTVVMREGSIVEEGRTSDLLRRAHHPYTRHLLACTPSLAVARPQAEVEPARETGPVFALRELYRSFEVGRWPRRETIQAVQDLTLTVASGSCLGVVGESGSGKTTLIRIMAGLERPSSGSLFFQDAPIGEWLSHAAQRLRFHREVQFVFQDPRSAFNPRRTIGSLLEAPLRHLTALGKEERRQRVRETLQQCQMDETVLSRYAHEFSGGQAQRLAIARALMTRPKVVLMDEPVSALDVSVQKDILELLRRLQEEMGLTMVFVSHDLAVVSQLCDRVAVMKAGRLVEEGATAAILHSPQQAYTQSLLESVYTLESQSPDPADGAPEVGGR